MTAVEVSVVVELWLKKTPAHDGNQNHIDSCDKRGLARCGHSYTPLLEERSAKI